MLVICPLIDSFSGENQHTSGGLHIDNTGYAYPDAGAGIDSDMGFQSSQETSSGAPYYVRF